MAKLVNTAISVSLCLVSAWLFHNGYAALAAITMFFAGMFVGAGKKQPDQ